MQSVALIDYGSGNLRSAEKALVRAAAGTSQIVVTARLLTVRVTRADSAGLAATIRSASPNTIRA